jgi:hypothetical protein
MVERCGPKRGSLYARSEGPTRGLGPASASVRKPTLTANARRGVVSGSGAAQAGEGADRHNTPVPSLGARELVALRMIAALGVAVDGDQVAYATGTATGWEREMLLGLAGRGLIEGDGGTWELTPAGRGVLVMTERELAALAVDAPAEEQREYEAALNQFSPAASKLVTAAKSESTSLDYHQIDTEHLLLALLREDKGIVAEVLAIAGITLDRARAAVSSLVITRANGDAEGIMFTPRARRTLIQALREALSIQDVEIEPRHILLALLDPREGIASQIVEDLDLDASTLRSALDAAGDHPDAWASIKPRLIETRIECLSAFILAAKSPPQLLDAISVASNDANAASAVATLLSVSDRAARYVIRRPVARFTPTGVAAAERTRDELANRRKPDASQD